MKRLVSAAALTLLFLTGCATRKGAGGGSYVTRPTVDHISEFLRSSINLMTESRDLSLEELLEARDLLVVIKD